MRCEFSLIIGMLEEVASDQKASHEVVVDPLALESEGEEFIQEIKHEGWLVDFKSIIRCVERVTNHTVFDKEQDLGASLFYDRSGLLDRYNSNDVRRPYRNHRNGSHCSCKQLL